MSNAAAAKTMPAFELTAVSLDEIDLVSGGEIDGREAALIALATVALIGSGVGLGLAVAYGGATVAGAVGIGVAGASTGLSAAGLGVAIVDAVSS